MDGAQDRQFSHGRELTATPFASEWVSLTRQEHIHLVWESRHFQRMHRGAVERIAQLEAAYRERLQCQAADADERERALQADLEYARGAHPGFGATVIWQEERAAPDDR